MRVFRLVLVLSLALVAGCGGGAGGRSSTTSTSAATTAPASSSSSIAASTTSEAATTVASRPTPTEPASSALANGIYPVYLTGVDVSHRTITVDVVQVLARTDPQAATVCPEIASGGIDGYCIKNANTRLRTLPIQPSASLRVLNGSDLQSVDLAGLAAARHPQPAASFYEITVVAGHVTAAKELYRP